MKKLLPFVFCLVVIMLFLEGNDSIRYSEQALTIWFEQLVPSLFISMVLIRTLYKQQIIAYLCPLFLCRFFRCSKQEMALIISSMLLGFPNGSMLIDDACKQGVLDTKQGEKLFLLCSFPAPGFVLLTCGVSIYHSITIGCLLFLSQLLYGFMMLFFRRGHTSTNSSYPYIQPHTFMNDVSTSMSESGLALFMIGGYLMLFMSITGILFSYVPNGVGTFLRICSEFSSGVFLLQTTTFSYYPSLLCTCALLGFGGFCVHMQIYSLCTQCRVSYLHYFVYRILQALLTTIILCVLLFLFV